MNLQYQSKSSEKQAEEFWPQLKEAISSTSGFHSWATENGVDLDSPKVNMDELIYTYLRQTLETLAY